MSVIITIEPKISNSAYARKAMDEVARKYNITRYYMFVSPKYLTVDFFHKEDATVFELAEGGQTVHDQVNYMLNDI